MDFYKELENTDFDDLFDRLVAYASAKLKSVDIRTMDGKEPCDLVADLFEKVLTNVRKAENASCTLKEFLFGCLRSDIDAFFHRKKPLLVTANEGEVITNPVTEAPKQSAATKEHYINQLKGVGADEEEISVFNIWAEGITKPCDVGTELDLSSSTIYKIQRRLLKHQEDIRKKSKAVV